MYENLIFIREFKVEFVKILLSYGCDDTIKNSNGWLPIHLAAITGKQGDEIVKLLLEYRKENAKVTRYHKKILIYLRKKML